MAEAKSLAADPVRRPSVEGVVVGALWGMAAIGLAGVGVSALYRWAPEFWPAGSQLGVKQFVPLPLGAALAAIAAFLGYRSGARRDH